jgi:hypothetical protein
VSAEIDRREESAMTSETTSLLDDVFEVLDDFAEGRRAAPGATLDGRCPVSTIAICLDLPRTRHDEVEAATYALCEARLVHEEPGGYFFVA